MKIKFLWMAVLCAAFLSACSDDDEKKALSKAFTYDGKEVKITGAIFDEGNLEEGNYDLSFTTEEGDYIDVELSGEWDGKTVDLTEEDNEFDWSWYIYYEKYENEEWIELIDGFGSDVESFKDVAGGSLYIKLVDEENNIFDVRLTVETTEGKTFKLNYKGEFTPNGDMPARTRKQQ